MRYKILFTAALVSTLIFFPGCAKDPQNDRVAEKAPEAAQSEIQKQVEEKTMMPTHQIYVEGAGDVLGAEVRLNDLPIGMIPPDGMRFTFHAEFSLLPGKNTLTLQPIGAGGLVSARVASYLLNDPVDGQGGEVLLEVTANSADPVEASFTLSEDRPKWSWMDADRVDNDEAYKDAIIFAKDFYKILMTGDMDKILPVLQPVHTDMSKLTPDVSVELRNQESTEGMANRINKPIWQFDEIDNIEFDVVPVANGKLYLVQRKDGSELFRTSQESRFDRYTFYKMIGRKNGAWAFYR